LEAGSAVSKELLKLMKIPVDAYQNLITVLKLAHYGPLVEYFDCNTRKSLGCYLISNALDNETVISTPEEVSHCCHTCVLRNAVF
jgi:vacuolar protein sorting-associated protein 35